MTHFHLGMSWVDFAEKYLMMNCHLDDAFAIEVTKQSFRTPLNSLIVFLCLHSLSGEGTFHV